MKKEGLATNIKSLITMTDVTPALLSDAQEQGVEVHTWSHVIQQGESGTAPDFNESEKDDVYIFSYTSGTTGDSKGVKLSHTNVISNARCTIDRIAMRAGETLISYLPYTHSFEQMLLGFTLIQ